MDFLLACKSYLEEFNYPNVNSLDEFQLVDLFSKENRYSLLCWINKVISKEFLPPIEHSPEAENLLAQHLFENGFCRSSQKFKFVTGVGLDVVEEIKIFKRIFAFMRTVKYKSELKSNDDNNISNLTNFLNHNINLFPSYGPIKVYSDKERQAKHASYSSKLKELEEAKRHTIESSNNCSKTDLNSLCNDSDFKSMVVGFQEKAFKIDEANVTIMRHYKKNNELQCPLKGNENLLRKCTKEVNHYSKLVQNYDSVLDVVSENEKTVKLSEEVKEMEKIVKNNAVLCLEIIQLQKGHLPI